MDFSPSDRVPELLERVRAFNAEHRSPVSPLAFSCAAPDSGSREREREPVGS